MPGGHFNNHCVVAVRFDDEVGVCICSHHTKAVEPMFFGFGDGSSHFDSQPIGIRESQMLAYGKVGYSSTLELKHFQETIV